MDTPRRASGTSRAGGVGPTLTARPGEPLARAAELAVRVQQWLRDASFLPGTSELSGAVERTRETLLTRTILLDVTWADEPSRQGADDLVAGVVRGPFLGTDGSAPELRFTARHRDAAVVRAAGAPTPALTIEIGEGHEFADVSELVRRRFESCVPDVVLARQTLLGLASALEAAHTLLLAEERACRVKRALLQARAAESARASGAGVDVMAELRNRAQGAGTALETELLRRAAGLIATGDGPLATALEAELASLTALRCESGARIATYRLPEDFRNRLQRRLAEWLGGHGQVDLERMRSASNRMREEFDAVLAREGIPATVALGDMVPETEITRALQAVQEGVGSFRVEHQKVALFDLLLRARRYQVFLYLLGPMLLGTGLSNDANRMKFILLSGLVLLAGVLQVALSWPEERRETAAREVDRARDSLRVELRRAFAEFERAWPALLVRSFRDGAGAALARLDAPVRTELARRAAEAAEDRQRVQRQLQALETNERKLVALRRQREQLALDLAVASSACERAAGGADHEDRY